MNPNGNHPDAGAATEEPDWITAQRDESADALITASSPPGAPTGGDGMRTMSSWTPVDLTDALVGKDVPAPELFHRDDGLPLLYRGRVHWFQGESECLKSWAAQLAVAEVLKAEKGRVLYIDFEDDERGVVARLLALSVPDKAIAGRFTYLRPDEPLMDRQGRITPGYQALAAVLETGPFDLAVIDGVTEAMTTEALSLLDNAEIAKWLRRLPRRLAARGAAVVCIDHVVKATENQGRYAIGGAHKLNGLTGAAYSFTALRSLGRADRAPIIGLTLLKVPKDRVGYIRGRCPDKRVGTLSLTSWPDGGVTGTIVAPGTSGAANGADEPDPALVALIVDHLRLYDGASANNVEQAVPGKGTTVRAALAWMGTSDRELVRVVKEGQAHRHYLTDAGRLIGSKPA